MSQHLFSTVCQGCSIKVVIGYDRALGHIFMNIVSDGFVGKGVGNVCELYTSIQDVNAGLSCTDVSYYRNVLSRLGITVPESMFAEVMRDQYMDVGNRIVSYKSDGSMDVIVS